MSPIDLAMDALQKRTPRSYRGEGGEQFAEHAMTEGADTPEDISQEEYQDMMDDISDEEAQDFRNPSDLRYPSEIPIEDPARHQRLNVGRQEAMREGIDVPTSDELTPMERFELERRQLRDPTLRPQSPATNPFKMGPSL